MHDMLLEIAVTLIMAKILNYVFEKYNQPGVIGEILAGIILGPCCIGYFSGTTINLFNLKVFEFNLRINSPEFKELSFIGIVFLLFLFGLNTNVSDLKKTGKVGFSTGIFAIFIPFLLGFVFGYIFHLNLLMCVGIGIIFFSSSVTISLRMLSDLDMLATRVGTVLQTAGITNDIVGLFIFSILIGQGHPFVFILNIFIFVILIFVIGSKIVKYSIKKGMTRQTSLLVLPIGLIICFLFAALAEETGLAAMLGAFIAGLIIRKTPQAGMINSYVDTIGYTLFIPLFFVWIGASFDFFILAQAGASLYIIMFILIFLILGLLGNFLGGAVGAKLAGFNRKDSFSVGLGMVPIMGMALVFASTEIDKGIFGPATGALAQHVKTATFLLIIVSCFIAPHLLKRNITSSFIQKNKLELVSKMRGVIEDKYTYRVSYKTESFVNWRNKKLLVNIFLIALSLQLFLTARIFYHSDISILLTAIFGGFIGSCFGYLTLKYILLQKSIINPD